MYQHVILLAYFCTIVFGYKLTILIDNCKFNINIMCGALIEGY